MQQLLLWPRCSLKLLCPPESSGNEVLNPLAHGFGVFLTLAQPLYLSPWGCWAGFFPSLSGCNVPFFLQLLGEMQSHQMHWRCRPTVSWGGTAGPLSPWHHCCSHFPLRVSLWFCVPYKNPCPRRWPKGNSLSCLLSLLPWENIALPSSLPALEFYVALCLVIAFN